MTDWYYKSALVIQSCLTDILFSKFNFRSHSNWIVITKVTSYIYLVTKYILSNFAKVHCPTGQALNQSLMDN